MQLTPRIYGIIAAAIGVRGRGMGHARAYAASKYCQLKVICDVDKNLLTDSYLHRNWSDPSKDKQYSGRIAYLEEHAGNKYKIDIETDLRRIMDDKEIDLVSIATPDHWHAVAAIWACQAGKDVYVEKPCCHTIEEGRKMIQASRKYNRLMQVGFQSRGSGRTRGAVAFLRSGKLGKIYMARALCFKARDPIGIYPDGFVEDTDQYKAKLIGNAVEHLYFKPFTSQYMSKVDYDLWLGPAPKQPFNPNRFHYNWHWYWNYGSGDSGNQAPHETDVARWGLGKDEHPVKITSSGGRFGEKDAGETPNTQISVFEYSDGTILQQDTRGFYTNKEGGVGIGAIFYGSKGYLAYGNRRPDTIRSSRS